MAIPAKDSITQGENIKAGAEPPSFKLATYLPVELRAQLARAAAKTDEILIRLQRLFTPTSNIDVFLAPLQYSACLVSYLQKDIHPRSASTAGALDNVVGSWRNTLRLLQIPVLYTLLRGLLSQTASSRGDLLIWRINVAQCLFYLVYQLQENTAHLIDLGLLSSSTVPIPLYRTQAILWLHSNRFWLLGVTCDLLRVAREAILERSRRKTSSADDRSDPKLLVEQRKVDKKWLHDFTVAGSTWPLCLHWSLENGLSKFNDGIIGVLGILASYETLKQRWEETRIN